MNQINLLLLIIMSFFIIVLLVKVVGAQEIDSWDDIMSLPQGIKHVMPI